MLPKNFFYLIIQYLITSLIEKLWLTLIIGWVIISSWKWWEFMLQINAFFHKIAPFIIEPINNFHNFSIGFNHGLFHNISIIIMVGTPMISIFLLIWIIWDITLYTTWINLNIKHWLNKHKKWSILVLFWLSLAWNFHVMYENWHLNSLWEVLFTLLAWIIMFLWIFLLSIGPWIFIYFYTLQK